MYWKMSLVFLFVFCVGCGGKSEYTDFITATVTHIDGEVVARLEQSSGAFFGNESVKVRSDAELFITATTKNGETYYFKARRPFLDEADSRVRSVATLAYALKKRMENSAVRIKFPKKYYVPWHESGQTKYLFAEDYSGEVPVDMIIILPEEK